MEEEILKRYFLYKMKQIDIAKKLNISKYKVSRVVTKDPRYFEEKENRKRKNIERHKSKTKQYITNKRKQKNNEMAYAQLKQAHAQASMELSGGRKAISNRAYRDWNISAYDYDNRLESYILKEGITAGADVPRRIKWKQN